MEESDTLLCPSVPGYVPGCLGSPPAAGAKFKGLSQQHLSFASRGVGPRPRAEDNWLCLFQNKGLSPGLLGALTSCLHGSDQLARLIKEALYSLTAVIPASAVLPGAAAGGAAAAAGSEEAKWLLLSSWQQSWDFSLSRLFCLS